MKRCPECEGVGEMEYEKWSYRSFQDDVGGFESDWQSCQNCEMAQVKLRRTTNDRGSNKHGVLREAFRRIR
jgi:hypothetical protein